MAKAKRYTLKKVMEAGRGGGSRIPAWYVFDNQTRRGVSATSIIKDLAQKLCDNYNKMHEDKVFEDEVLK
jgi:hypothetical protein